MKRGFREPYKIIYPVLSHDGKPHKVNEHVRDFQGDRFREDFAWLGDLIIVRCTDQQLNKYVDIKISDYPIIKNYLRRHGTPLRITPS